MLAVRAVQLSDGRHKRYCRVVHQACQAKVCPGIEVDHLAII